MLDKFYNLIAVFIIGTIGWLAVLFNPSRYGNRYELLELYGVICNLLKTRALMLIHFQVCLIFAIRYVNLGIH